MNDDYLEIFSDVVLLATFQPRQRERYSSQPRLEESGHSRPRVAIVSDRRFDDLERI